MTRSTISEVAGRGCAEPRSVEDYPRQPLGKGDELPARTSRRPNAKDATYTQAKTVLGTDFLPPNEIAAALDVTYTDAQMDIFVEAQPNQEQLEWCRNHRCMLVAGPPTAMSILDIRRIENGHFYLKRGGWYTDERERFATGDKIGPIWIAIRKDPISGSLGRAWSEQEALVTSPLFVPNVAEIVWALTTFKATRGIYLFATDYVRTSSRDMFGVHVSVGGFDSDGLEITHYRDNGCVSRVGVSAARKS